MRLRWLTGQITLQNVGGDLSVWGRLRAVATVACGRCLAEHDVPIEFEFSETYAFANIKPTDPVCVGVYTEHDPDQVHENVALTVRLSCGTSGAAA